MFWIPLCWTPIEERVRSTLKISPYILFSCLGWSSAIAVSENLKFTPNVIKGIWAWISWQSIAQSCVLRISKIWTKDISLVLAWRTRSTSLCFKANSAAADPYRFNFHSVFYLPRISVSINLSITFTTNFLYLSKTLAYWESPSINCW